MGAKQTGWRDVANGAQAKAHGHTLLIMGEGDRWLKWIDRHFRGSVERFDKAKEQLEREAAGEGEAWGNK